MTRSSVRPRRYRGVALALLTVTLVPGLAQLPAVATESTPTPATPQIPLSATMKEHTHECFHR